MPEDSAQITVREVHEHRLPAGVLGVAVEDAATIYAGCMDGVYQVDTATGDAERIIAHESYVSSVSLLPSQQQLVSAGYDGVLCWIDLNRGEWIRKIRAHDFWSWSMRTSADDRYLASVTGQYLAGGAKYEPAAEREPSVAVYDAQTAAIVQHLSHVPPVQAVAISPDSRYVAAANLMGEIRIWEIESGDEIARWTTPDFTSWGIVKSHCYIGGIYDLQFSPDGEHLFATGMGSMRDPMAGNGAQMWQRFAWRESPVLKVSEFKEGEGLMETLAIDPLSRWLVMAGRLRGGPRNVGIFDLASGALLHSINTKDRVTQAAFTEDGGQLILAGCKSQAPKDGEPQPFGRVHVFAIG